LARVRAAVLVDLRLYEKLSWEEVVEVGRDGCLVGFGYTEWYLDDLVQVLKSRCARVPE
jgi:hypothetical protein